MNDDQKADMRLQCLHVASRALGEDVDPTSVLEYAQDYYEWIMGKKAELRVVSNNDDPSKEDES